MELARRKSGNPLSKKGHASHKREEPVQTGDFIFHRRDNIPRIGIKSYREGRRFSKRGNHQTK
jgi:hypothetical protein